jgi:hypothetical protein
MMGFALDGLVRGQSDLAGDQRCRLGATAGGRSHRLRRLQGGRAIADEISRRERGACDSRQRGRARSHPEDMAKIPGPALCHRFATDPDGVGHSPPRSKALQRNGTPVRKSLARARSWGIGALHVRRRLGYGVRPVSVLRLEDMPPRGMAMRRSCVTSSRGPQLARNSNISVASPSA